MNARSLAFPATYHYSLLIDHMKLRSTVILIGLGVLAAVVHATFRFPLRLPGHHGLEWMALLVIARQASSYRWSATVAAFGAAVSSALPILGFHDPLTPLTYLAPGVAVDLLCLVVPTAKRNSVIFLGAAAALAYATKPLIQWAGGLALGLRFDGWSVGLAYLVAMHMLFAFTGGSVAAYLWRRASPR